MLRPWLTFLAPMDASVEREDVFATKIILSTEKHSIGIDMKPIWLIILSSLLLSSCTQGEGIIMQTSRDNVVDISDDLYPLELPDSVLINSYADIDSQDGYVSVTDLRTIGNYLYIFDARTTAYLTSTIRFGDGPGEVSRMDAPAYCKDDNCLYVPDYGKDKLFRYAMDSLLSTDNSAPLDEYSLTHGDWLTDFEMLDSVNALGIMIEVFDDEDHYTCVLANYNIETGKHVDHVFHPEIKMNRLTMGISKKLNLCVVASRTYDFLILTDLEGNFIKEIRGPLWGKEKRLEPSTYTCVTITERHIIASFSGKTWGDGDDPTRLEIFTIDGEYVETLDVGHPISDICYNEATGRLFLSLNDDPQFVFYDFDE